MTTGMLTVDDVIHAWTSAVDEKFAEHPEAIQSSLQFTDMMLRLLAEGHPISTEQLAARAELPVEEIQAVFESVKKQGGEFDDAGNLVGAALTLNPTPHHFHVNGQRLYTWCALDAMFLPGLLGQTAEVESTCPTTQETIRLTIAPEGVSAYDPPGTVLSIVVPGVGQEAGDAEQEQKTGPESASCSQMNFFSSRQAAESWANGRKGVVIFTVEEAYRLAYANWIARRENNSQSI